MVRANLLCTQGDGWVALCHFSSHFRTPAPRGNSLNWGELGLVCDDLGHLEEVFSEEEVHDVVQDIARDKAPGLH